MAPPTQNHKLGSLKKGGRSWQLQFHACRLTLSQEHQNHKVPVEERNERGQSSSQVWYQLGYFGVKAHWSRHWWPVLERQKCWTVVGYFGAICPLDLVISLYGIKWKSSSNIGFKREVRWSPKLPCDFPVWIIHFQIIFTGNLASSCWDAWIR